MLIVYLKKKENKTGSIQYNQNIINPENEKIKIEVLLKYYFIFEINKTCIVLKPNLLLCIILKAHKQQHSFSVKQSCYKI